MWKPKSIIAKKGKLDFSSSGQSIVEVNQIYFDDWMFCNGIDFLEIEGATIQFIVCSHCGYARCESGNYLTLRSCGDYVLLIPSFEEMGDDDLELNEFSAPYEVRKNGAIYLTKDQYSELRRIVPALAEYASLQPLMKKEVALLVQWEAPYNTLGDFPADIAFNEELYLTTESPLEERVVDKLTSLLHEFIASKEPVACTRSNEVNSSIFLDVNEFIQWNPITELNGKFTLRLEPGFEFKT
jgi:hypothetical protein